MKLLLICLFFVIAARTGSCNLRGVDTFEFGQNVGRVTFTASGAIPAGVRKRIVKVVIPDCTDLKYVRVDVNTATGDPPKVTFSNFEHVVTMEYSSAPWSKTVYSIIAKTIPNPHCLAAGKAKQPFVPILRSDEN